MTAHRFAVLRSKAKDDFQIDHHTFLHDARREFEKRMSSYSIVSSRSPVIALILSPRTPNKVNLVAC